MIDIMFLLLLFFMLGADMGQRELEEVMLPKAMSMKEDKENKEKDKNRLTINVYHRYEVKCAAVRTQERGSCRDDAHWRTGIKGKDYSEPEKLGGYLKKEADATRGLDPKNPQVSELKVHDPGGRSRPLRPGPARDEHVREGRASTRSSRRGRVRCGPDEEALDKENEPWAVVEISARSPTIPSRST